ncbi:hypothetical protein TNCT_12641 [Trichonephila clavata]|uniref:Uncharacterized protein n=1 Tax=Trichonephila clavata TaxID=2740835 RepID=A0A8X6LVK1_TRICU|nr:hypothetical protein TNCT_12641 [Trichonephila clavata]
MAKMRTQGMRKAVIEQLQAFRLVCIEIWWTDKRVGLNGVKPSFPLNVAYMLRTESSRCVRDRKTNKDLGVADRKVVGTTSVLHPLHPLSYHLLGMPCQGKNTEGHISDRSGNLASKYSSSAWASEVKQLLA